MLPNCPVSCHQSPQTATAYVYEGEDAAAGAIRLAEEHGLEDIPELIGGYKRLHEALSSGHTYTPPQELTHCSGSGSSGSTVRPCSAGKLWKRSEEKRKVGIHDDAGADLLRALAKSGLETDFVEKCHRSLQGAIRSIQRQREREQKEAEEEAKLEKRRLEEEEAMQESIRRKAEYEDAFGRFSDRMRQQLKLAQTTIEGDGSVETEGSLDDFSTNAKTSFLNDNCVQSLVFTKKIPLGEKDADLLLAEARCYELEGNFKLAMSSAAKVIQKTVSFNILDDSPTILAMQLGANAAMQLGVADSSLSFYSSVLKLDPEQKFARKQYRGLKKVTKLLNKAEAEIQKGYNNAAAELVEECLSAMRGLDVDSPLFRSKIMLKKCKILSSMGKHEQALTNCDPAVALRVSTEGVSAASRKEAHLVRAEALLLDDDYDEAVQDFRAAFDLVPLDDDTGEKMQLQQKLQAAIRKQEAWNGGKMDFRYNEKSGYPNGMPPQRDHAKILQLPVDLEERTKELKCAWLKKQFKLLVKKYHPDKYKGGNSKRAERKFREVKEAKETLSNAWSC
ncbi:MAG: hypothetical protein SGARI_002876 [Bacillariaceae sp.]